MDFAKNYVFGNWVKPSSGETIGVMNPATQEVFAHVPESRQEDVALAVAAAKSALPKWSAMPMEFRCGLMKAMLEYLESQAETIIDMEVKELGAPVSFARNAHCFYQFERIRSYIEVASNLELESKFPASLVIREPVGVVAAITPWNYPLGQLVQKVVPAILMGNTVVMKPSQVTPLSAFVLMDAFDKAGFPDGVLNLVSGKGSELGDAFAYHPDVDMVSFTGSTAVGVELAKKCFDSMKRVSLELGGKSPAIWLPSKSYDEYVPQLFNSIFLNSGQTCTALSRLIVPKMDIDKVREALMNHLEDYPVGDPADPKTKVGPMATVAQYKKVRDYIMLGLTEGAKLFAGEVPDRSTDSLYIKPTIFVDVDNSMRIAQEEIFGPVLCVLTYETVDDAVKIANDSIYGLNAAVNGPDEAEAMEVAHRLKAGNVYVNNAPRDVYAPFGGYKSSGFGREGGLYGLLEFTQLKAVFRK